jgi:hypothetical protein
LKGTGMNDDKFDPVLAEMVEREERADWFERNLQRRRLAPREFDGVGGSLMFYQIANAVMVLLIALGLYMLGQFDGMERGRHAAAKSESKEVRP